MHALLDGDIFAYRCAASAESEPEDIAIWRVDDSIEQVLAAVGAETFQVWLSDKRTNNFRCLIYPEYKANRTQPEPIHLASVKKHLLDKWNANIALGQEADDALGIAQCAAFNMDEETVICSIDKDLKQIPGKHYNFVKLEFDDITPLEGIRFFYKQLLIGDRADNVFGVKGIGPVKAAKYLDEVTDEPTMFEIVSGLYDSQERLIVNGKVLWIRQKKNKNGVLQLSAQWFKTRSGLSAVVLATDFDQKRCYLGAYFSDETWYPTTWMKSGRWHDEPGHPRGLDLMMEDTKSAA